MEKLKHDLKEQIIRELNLEGIRPDDIDNDAPLFGREEGLNLDSIDALELVVIMENYHKVRITDESVGKEVLYSINTMAEYIFNHRSESQE